MGKCVTALTDGRSSNDVDIYITLYLFKPHTILHEQNLNMPSLEHEIKCGLSKVLGRAVYYH